MNLKLNGMKAVIHQVALANYVGKSKIALNSSQDFGYAAGLGAKSLPGHRSVEVEVNVAKAYLNHSQNFPDLVKCDVETFEPNVLEGFGLVDFSNTIFLIEILNEKVAGELQSFFDPADFEFVNIDDINNRFRRQEKLSSSFTYNFLIYPKYLSVPVNLLLHDFAVET
jgi:FkbM family methyltransferase